MTLCTFGTRGALLYSHFVFFLFCSETQRIIIFMYKYMYIHVRQPAPGEGEEGIVIPISYTYKYIVYVWQLVVYVCVCERAFLPYDQQKIRQPLTIETFIIVSRSIRRLGTFRVEKTEGKEIRLCALGRHAITIILLPRNSVVRTAVYLILCVQRIYYGEQRKRNKTRIEFGARTF